MKLQRQGDFLFVETEGAANPAAGQIAGVGIISRSPLTGHAHAFTDAKLKMRTIQGGRDLVTLTEKPVKVVHEEHSSLEINPGVVLIRRQIERSSDGIREVVD